MNSASLSRNSVIFSEPELSVISQMIAGKISEYHEKLDKYLMGEYATISNSWDNFETTDKKIDDLHTKIDDLHTKIDHNHVNLNKKIDHNHVELKAQIDIICDVVGDIANIVMVPK